MTKFIKCFSIFIFIFINSSIYAQIIKIENGIAISSFHSKDLNILKQPITTYSALVGLDYWENKNFYLSSELGYLKKGGKEKNDFLPDDAHKIKESWNFIHLNTTIRFRLRIEKDIHFFVGAGPKLDILISSKEFKNFIYKDYKMNTLSFGAKGEFGFTKDFNDIRTGINFSYLYDLGRAANSDFINLKNNAYMIMLSIGYNLR